MSRFSLFLFLALATPAARAQQANSVTQTLFTGVSTAQTTQPLRNVGQIGHQVFLRFTNAPAHTCTQASALAQLEFSFDNSTYFALGQPSNAAGALPVTSQLYIGAGLFNFVRFHLTSFDNTNCLASAYYTGTPNAILLQAAQGVVGVGSQLGLNGTFAVPPLFIGGAGNGGTSRPVVACDQTAGASITAGSTLAIILGGATTTIHVCSIAVAMSAAGTFRLIEGTASDCSTATTNISPIFPLAASTPFTLGSGLGQVFGTAFVADHLCVVAVTGDVRVLASYTQF